VLDVENRGKLGQFPLVAGHSGEVLDIEFSPFNPSIVGSVSDDGYAKIWSIPAGGLKETLTTPVQSLSGHKRKVGTINFNPVASNVVATTSTDNSVKVWDLEKGSTIVDLPGASSDIVQSAAWNYNGQLFSFASKDKQVRVIDPRSNSTVQQVEAHAGIKGMRVTFLGRKEKLVTMGFSKTSERQYSLWDPRNLSTVYHSENIDTGSGILMPFYDDDTSVLYLAGKGDGNIRYYELVDEAPYIYFLTEYKSNTPQRGMAMFPKLGMDLGTCEIARLLKLTQTAVEPINFTVPRKSDIFQDDLYPPTFSGEPVLNAAEWASGKNAEPKLISLSPGFVPAKPAESSFTAAPVQVGKTDKELLKEFEDQTKRIAYLEAELVKRDARIRDLGGK